MDKFIARVRNRRQEKLRKKRNKKILISISLLFISIIVFGVCLYRVKNLNNYNVLSNNNATEQINEPSKQHNTLKISFVGNIICYTSQTKDALNNDTNTFDYSYLFENVKTHLSSSDLAIGTLETNFNVGEANQYDDLNTPKELAITLKDLGFDILLTATNHCLDEKEAGLKSTLDVLDNLRNISYWNFKN